MSLKPDAFRVWVAVFELHRTPLLISKEYFCFALVNSTGAFLFGHPPKDQKNVRCKVKGSVKPGFARRHGMQILSSEGLSFAAELSVVN